MNMNFVCVVTSVPNSSWWGTTGDYSPAYTDIDKYINPNNAAHHAFLESEETMRQI